MVVKRTPLPCGSHQRNQIGTKVLVWMFESNLICLSFYDIVHSTNIIIHPINDILVTLYINLNKFKFIIINLNRTQIYPVFNLDEIESNPNCNTMITIVKMIHHRLLIFIASMPSTEKAAVLVI